MHKIAGVEKEPWDLPSTAEAREQLIVLAEQFESEGKLKEFGRTLIRLAQVVKQVGSGREGVHAFAWTSSLGLTAAAALRQTDDRAGLASALRAAAQPFVIGIDREALLREALEISTEIGDKSGQGWAHFAMTPPGPVDPEDRLSRAERCFVEGGNKVGLALVKRRQGARNHDGQAFLDSADLYEEAGEWMEAHRSLTLANLFGRKQFLIDEREAILLRSLAIATAHGEPKDVYRSLDRLQDLMKQARRKKDRNRYLEDIEKLGDVPLPEEPNI